MKKIVFLHFRRNLWIGFLLVIAAFLTAFTMGRYQKAQNMTEDHVHAERMNLILSDYFDEFGPVELNAPEIRSLVNRYYVFNFVPIDQRMSYWYEIDEKRVIVSKKYENLSVYEFNTMESGDQLEEVIKGYLLLDTDGSTVAKTIHSVRNLIDEKVLTDNQTGAIPILREIGLGDHIEQFTLDRSVYVNDVYRLTRIQGPIDRTKIIFSDDLEVIHQDVFSDIEGFLPLSIRIPLSVVLIEADSFYDLDPFLEVVHDEPLKLMIEEYAFHPGDAKNARFHELEGIIVFQRLEIEIDFLIPTILHYQDQTRIVYLGKTVEDRDRIHAFDAVDEFIGSYDKNNFYDSRGNVVVSGDDYERLVYLSALFYSSRYYAILYQQNLTIRVIGDTEEEKVVISSFTTTFHLLDNRTIIEAKGFDEQGEYIARGTRVIEYEVFDRDDFGKPSNPVFP